MPLQGSDLHTVGSLVTTITSLFFFVWFFFVFAILVSV